MALLFVDSFDHYATADLLEKWTSLNAGSNIAINATGGRRGSQSLRCTLGGQNAIVRGLSPSGTTGILGTAVKCAGIGGQKLLAFTDGATTRDQVQVGVNADGSLTAYRGTAAGFTGAGTSLGVSAAGLVSAGVTFYLEVKVVLHASTGAVTIRVNGAAVLTLTGVNTVNSTGVWTAIWIGNAAMNTTTDHDDVYVLDGSGAAPWQDFLGDCRVDARYPTGAGATTGWTPSAGANWAAVDDAAPNDDTDYTSAAAAGVTDTFVTQDAPVVGAAIYGVQHVLSMKKTDAGAASVAPVIRHSGTDYPGAALNPGTTYAYLLQIAATNPGTAAAWTEAGFNAAEFGYTRTV